MQLKQIQGYIQSIYLAVYDDKILLLDGCCKADVELIYDYITNELNRPIEHLSAIIVTHMHPDHAGAANTLKQRYGCKIYSGNARGEWYNGIDGFLMYLTDVLLGQWVAKRLRKPRKSLWFWPRLNVDLLLNDGQLIPQFEDWQVIETHGHTDRDISLFHQPTKKVYVADLAVTVKNNYIPPFPVCYPNRYRHSLAKIAKLKPSSVILAHGGEVNFTPQHYQHLVSLAPEVPVTVWRVTKLKLAKVLKRR